MWTTRKKTKACISPVTMMMTMMMMNQLEILMVMVVIEEATRMTMSCVLAAAHRKLNKGPTWT